MPDTSLADGTASPAPLNLRPPKHPAAGGPHRRNRYGATRDSGGLGHGGEEVLRVDVAESFQVLLHLMQRRRVHSVGAAVCAIQVTQRPTQRAGLRVESQVDQD